MDDQLQQIIRGKILTAVETLPVALTRRDAVFPDIHGKALAVIGMRRAGKTTYLHQIRGDKIAAGRSARGPYPKKPHPAGTPPANSASKPQQCHLHSPSV